MGKVMRHTLGASLNIRHNLSASKAPKRRQSQLLSTYIPRTSAFTLAFSTSKRMRTIRQLTSCPGCSKAPEKRPKPRRIKMAEEFLNTYYFVPLEEAAALGSRSEAEEFRNEQRPLEFGHAQYQRGRLSGRILCKLTAE